MMIKLLVNFPVLLPPNILILPRNKSVQHPLDQKMKFWAIDLSARHCETQVLLQKLLMLSQIRGERQPKGDMNRYSDDGLHMLHQGIRTPILQM